jgi:hypothetical protein
MRGRTSALLEQIDGAGRAEQLDHLRADAAPHAQPERLGIEGDAALQVVDVDANAQLHHVTRRLKTQQMGWSSLGSTTQLTSSQPCTP